MCIRDCVALSNAKNQIIMQLSTSRVNFTNTSVSQLNYVKFLSKRSSQKGVQDIVTILGLHTDDATTFCVTNTSEEKLCLVHAVEKIHYWSLVPYHPKQLKYNFIRPSEWFKTVLLVENHSNYVTRIECDLRSGTIDVVLSQKDNSFKILFRNSFLIMCKGYPYRRRRKFNGQLS